jgi:class 3 adenylate cyclase
VAARVQAQASTDEVLVSAATYEQIRGQVHAELRGKVPLKGRTQSVEIYRLLSAG